MTITPSRRNELAPLKADPLELTYIRQVRLEKWVAGELVVTEAIDLICREAHISGLTDRVKKFFEKNKSRLVAFEPIKHEEPERRSSGPSDGGFRQERRGGGGYRGGGGQRRGPPRRNGGFQQRRP